VRKQPLDDKSKNVIVDKLAKARLAKAEKASAKKQAEAQEKAELAELKSLKDKGQLKVKSKKDKPAEISIPKKKREKNVIVKEIHHYHDAKPVATEPTPKPKPPAPPKQPKQPAPPRMVFA
jgi:hypothetical protein